MQPHYLKIVILRGKRFLVVYLSRREHSLYRIRLAILYDTERLIKWMCRKYCLHKLGTLSIHIQLELSSGALRRAAQPGRSMRED